jgi:RNA polymerase sigma-70 factor (ECF subfamily)
LLEGSAASTMADLGQALIECQPDAVPVAWRRYQPLVRNMLRRALGTEGDVEDAVQDVFLCLLRRAHALRDKEAVRPFVIGITRHTLLRELRRRQRRQQLATEYGPASGDPSDVGGDASASYAAIKLNRMLQRLTEQERTSFVLRFGHGMTVPEVAQALRVSEPTAKRRLSRARASLSAWASNDAFLLGYIRGKKIGPLAALDG